MPGRRVAKLWRYGAGELLVACLGLELAVVASSLYFASSDGLNSGRFVFWTGLDLFLLWRIWRGGRTAWFVMVFLDALTVVLLLVSLVWPWGWYGTGILVILSAQLLMLLSPAIRHHDPKLQPQ